MRVNLRATTIVTQVMTALRSSVHEVQDGVRLLRPDPDIPYRDGAEDRVWEIVRAASDITSDSTEMLKAAKGWSEQYHVHPARANILRALDLPSEAAVLEIGSGCGPITRYLGETGAQIDAVEPVLPRARVGRERTRDLNNVEVFCGNLEDVPADAAYDLVVVVGVLEYVAHGSPEPEGYLDFLAACRMRLKPGGSLVLAIENKLGVKYLTGTGEDHSGRIFDSLEDYPRGTPARTFAPSALLDLVRASGFTPKLLSVFPDYKHTRVVFDAERLAHAAPDLVENLPTFPSRYAGTRSLRLASESRVWKELARAGVAAHFANSLLVIGGTDESPALWPEARLATYFSINRRKEYVAATEVVERAGEVWFDRTYSPAPGPLITDGMTSWRYVAGTSFLEAYASRDEPGRRALLRSWLDLVATTDGDVVSLDAIPTNLIVSGDEVELIDSEFHDRAPVERVIHRGLFWLAVHLARSTNPERWAPAGTIGQLMQQLAELAQVPVDDEAVEAFLASEGAFQIALSTHYLGADASTDARTHLRKIYDTDIWDVPLGRRLHHEFDNLVKAQATLRTHYDAAINQRTELRTALDRAVEQRRLMQRKLDQTMVQNDEQVDQLASQRQRLAELRRELKASRADLKRARGQLEEIRRSRAHQTAETVRRGVRKIRRLARRRTAP